MPTKALALLLLTASCVRHGADTTRPDSSSAIAPSKPTETAAIPGDAQTTASGLRYVISRGGTTGEPPGPNDRVVVRYAVHDERGHSIAATRDEATETLEMSALPTGWAEGMAMLIPGDRARLWLPAPLAYRTDEVGPNGALAIEVELVDILRGSGRDQPSATPPEHATRTKSGISYVVLTAGTGTAHPQAGARLTAHYVGWTAADGNQFDSSYERGEPIEFQAEQVIRGWGEATKLMVVGEKTRFWIPESLAYQGKPGRPAGMLIFDIELIGFTPGP
jgi:FKBP-type peptidyl-prolyl cis-trans isomerase